MKNKDLCIMLIENNPNGAFFIHDLLFATKQNYHLFWERSLQEALRNKNRICANIILLNLQPPDSRGLGALSTVQTAFPRIPIIVFTEKTDMKLHKKLSQEGIVNISADREIDKSCINDLILQTIENRASPTS